MNKKSQGKDFLEFILSLVVILLIAAIGAFISGVPGMFWFSTAALIIAFVLLQKRGSFYQWIHAFILVVMLLDKFVGLV